jgi:16S rRNA (cytosine1402-N4)-methyltransferase
LAHDDRESSLHVPVLLEEVLRLLDPKPGAIVVDATVGAGGHAAELLRRVRPGGVLFGLDRDREILPFARRRLRAVGGEFHLARAVFSELPTILQRWGARKQLDIALFDLGFSSLQVDSARRGFSFERDAPLDLRMGKGAEESARELLARVSEEELERILRVNADERYARRIAAVVVRERRRRPILRTRHLVELIERAVPRRPARIHPATKTFQALRIEVNREKEELEAGVTAAASELRTGGRLGVISFHSLEDRFVKRFFRDGVRRGELSDVSGGAVRPSEGEVRRNRRARSARLRVVAKREESTCEPS